MDVVKNIAETELDANSGGYSPKGIRMIRELLLNDRLFRGVNPTKYKAVLVTTPGQDIEVKVGSRLFGDIFFDTTKRFSDGEFIMASCIKNIEKLYHELYLVETENSTYLLVK